MIPCSDYPSTESGDVQPASPMSPSLVEELMRMVEDFGVHRAAWGVCDVGSDGEVEMDRRTDGVRQALRSHLTALIVRPRTMPPADWYLLGALSLEQAKDAVEGYLRREPDWHIGPSVIGTIYKALLDSESRLTALETELNEAKQAATVLHDTNAMLINGIYESCDRLARIGSSPRATETL